MAPVPCFCVSATFGIARTMAASQKVLITAVIPTAVSIARGTSRVGFTVSSAGPQGTAAAGDLSRSLVLEQLVLVHVAHDARRHAHEHLAGRRVLGDHRAGGDERFLADLDGRAQHDAAADAGPAADGRAPDELMALLGATHEVVVGGLHARRDEAAVLDSHVRGDVHVGLDLGEVADGRVVLDHAAAAHDDLLAEPAALAHPGVVAEDATGAQRGAAVDDRAAADHAAGAEHQPGQLAALGGARRRERRDLAQDDVVLDETPVADHRVVVHHDVGAEDDVLADLQVLAEQQIVTQLGRLERHRHLPQVRSDVLTGWPPLRRLRSMASSTRTTLSASRPSLSTGSSLRMQSTKCWASTRSGSSLPILGMWMSPKCRVTNSP